jgi:hypothetical protein
MPWCDLTTTVSRNVRREPPRVVKPGNMARYFCPTRLPIRNESAHHAFFSPVKFRSPPQRTAGTRAECAYGTGGAFFRDVRFFDEFRDRDFRVVLRVESTACVRLEAVCDAEKVPFKNQIPGKRKIGPHPPNPPPVSFPSPARSPCFVPKHVHCH